MAKEDKLKALDAAIAQIERQYGYGSGVDREVGGKRFERTCQYNCPGV